MQSELMISITIAAVGIGIAVVGLLLRKPLEGKLAIPSWLASAVACLFLGLALGSGLMYSLGYHWEPQEPIVQMSGGFGGGGGGPGGGGGGGMMMGMGGAPGGGGGGGQGGAGGRPQGPPPQVTLASFVRKLEMLERGLSISLTADQAAKLRGALEEIDAEAELSREAAEEKLESLMSILSDEQKEVVESIELPRRRSQQGGAESNNPRAGLPADLPSDVNLQSVAYAMSFTNRPNPNANPFKTPENQELLENLRGRLAEHKR
jgi:hypothetical protein